MYGVCLQLDSRVPAGGEKALGFELRGSASKLGLCLYKILIVVDQKNN